MIDFSTLQGLTIPEGKVKSIRIVEADGTAYEVGFAKMATITITCSVGNEIAEPYIEINGEVHTIYDGDATLSVPLGTVIKLGAVPKEQTDSYNYAYLYLNGQYMNEGLSEGELFSHTVNGNATIELINKYSRQCQINIEAENVEMATVTIESPDEDWTETSLSGTGGGVYNVPVGCRIYVWVDRGNAGTARVILNGTTVVSTSDAEYYYFTITRNTTIIKDAYSSSGGGTITITEIPEGYALVNITGYGNAYGCYITIDGALYTGATTIAVPIGTTISCIANVNATDKFGYVSVNGSKVAENGKGYVYTVIGDVTIYMYWNKGGGYIEITET